jgi:6-phosphogluconolactonase
MDSSANVPHILPGPEEAVLALAEFIVALSRERIEADGRFTIALSGGSTPRCLYEVLASPPRLESVAWGRWHVFWGDERCVPPDHQDSNYRVARESLLGRVPIPKDQVHRMQGEANPQSAAEEYEGLLRRVLQGTTPVLDLILLGIGEDGHTASLFSDTDALLEKERLVVANRAPHFQAHRITVTIPLINAARAIAFLVTDESKAGVLRQVLKPASNEPPLPASLVRPAPGTVHWFLTAAARPAVFRRQGVPCTHNKLLSHGPASGVYSPLMSFDKLRMSGNPDCALLYADSR